jgi:hypothetical protein
MFKIIDMKGKVELKIMLDFYKYKFGSFIVTMNIVMALFCISETVKSQELNSLENLIGEGTQVHITPEVVKRDVFYTFEINIILGKDGLLQEDSFGIVNGSNIDRWHFGFPNNYWGQEVCWQTDDPGASNNITVSCSKKESNVKLKVGKYGKIRPYSNSMGHFLRSVKERMRYVLEITTDTNLEKGDTITIKWGVKQGQVGGVKTPAFATNYYFLPFIYSRLPESDMNLPIRRGEFLMLPSVKVVGHDAERLYVTCQPLHTVNDVFNVKIAAIDKYGNPAEDFEGEVNLYCSDNGIELPDKVRFSKDDRGAIEITGVKTLKEGWFKILAECGNVSGKSNYLIVSKEPVKDKLYFGDMHAHTLDCDGTNDILEHFDYGSRIAGLDFASVSPHIEYIGTKKAWDRYLMETSKANNSGNFVTFYGYEWAMEGHTNAYFINEKDVAIIYPPRLKEQWNEEDQKYRIKASTEGMFMQKLKELKSEIFAIAHVHTAYSDSINDDVLWLDEIYSCHKHERKEREERLRKNLERGLYLGVVAGSDMHRLTIGHLCKEPGKIWPQGGWENCQYQTAGLQATFTDKLNRKSLYNGMLQRNTYGTSGARIVLIFSCEDHSMGSQIEINKNKKPTFSIEVGGTTKIDEVVICKYDGSEWKEINVLENSNNDRWTGEWLDKDFNQRGIYYVRVKQRDGENAWSSPIWVNHDK